MSRSSMFTCMALAVAFLLVSATVADAQDRGRGGRGGRFGGFFGRGGPSIDKVTLAGLEQVQKEIKVTEAQKTKIDGVLADFRDQRRELRTGLGNFRDMSREERNEAMAALRTKQEKLAATFGKKIDGVLEKAQVKRLDEIALQQKGVQALTAAPVAAALKLSDEQVKQLKAVFKSEEDALQTMRQNAFQGRDRDNFREAMAEMQEKTQKLRKESEAKALKVLSEEQQKQFVAMKGKEFELDRQALRRGFGRGGQGGARRGEGGGGRRGEGGQRRRPPVDDA